MPVSTAASQGCVGLAGIWDGPAIPVLWDSLICSLQPLSREAEDEQFAVSDLFPGPIHSWWLLLQKGLDTCHK